MNIFPAPSKCEKKEGAFTFSENDTLFLIIDSGVKNADFGINVPSFGVILLPGKRILRWSKKTVFRAVRAIAKSRDCFPEDESTEYEYVIRCTENAVNIAYSCENGLIHAFSTLLQIISPYSNANGELFRAVLRDIRQTRSQTARNTPLRVPRNFASLSQKSGKALRTSQIFPCHSRVLGNVQILIYERTRLERRIYCRRTAFRH